MTDGGMEIVVVIKYPWWFGIYMKALILFCFVFGTEPDWDKFENFARRHIKAVMKAK